VACRIYRLAAELVKRKTWGGGAQDVALLVKLRRISTIFVCGEFVDSRLLFSAAAAAAANNVRAQPHPGEVP
jgi:hypothetical protein